MRASALMASAAFSLLIFASGVAFAQVIATEEFDSAISLLKSKHMNSSKADWPKLEASARDMLVNARSAEEAYPAIRFLIDRLNEKHTQLISAKRYQELKSAPVAESSDKGTVLPNVATIDANVGLLKLHELLASNDVEDKYRATLREGISERRAAGICRFVVDLRDDPGGNMWPMLDGLLPLLGQPPFGHFLYADGIKRTWGIEDRRPSVLDPDERSGSNDVALKNPAIAVLIGPDTTSSGEFVAVALRGLPNAKFFGEATGGYVTINGGDRLPDGAMLAISKGYSSDRLDRPVLTSIVPDFNLSGDATVMNGAVDWLKSQKCSN